MLTETTAVAGGHASDDDDDGTDDIGDLHGFTGRWIALAHKAMRAELDRRLGEVGGSLSTFQVLRAADEGGAPTQIELAGVLGITGSTLVRHLDRMAADGLIERHVEGADRRVRRIRLTPAGRTLLHRLAAVAQQSERAVAALLTEEERAGLRHALRTIADHFGAADRHVRAPVAAKLLPAPAVLAASAPLRRSPRLESR